MSRSDTSRGRASQSRSADNTKSMERPRMDRWSPAQVLELPPAKNGYRNRWVAEYVNGAHVPQNVQRAIREGYERVHVQEFEGSNYYITDEEKGDGFARQGGLILMRIPEDFAQQREEYYSRRSAEGLKGANELQGVAGRDAVYEDRGSRTLSGADAGAALRNMSSQ